jgi:predicted nucleic acid-binding protein
MELAYGAERFQIRTGSVRYWVVLEDLKRNHYRDNILPFDGEASLICGRLQAGRERIGRPISMQDAMIAAICIANGATLATRNAADFAGLDLKVVNPFEPG